MGNLTCDICKREFYSPAAEGVLLYNGQCLDCITPENQAILRQTLGDNIADRFAEVYKWDANANEIPTEIDA